MKQKRLLQIFVLLILLFTPPVANRLVRASSNGDHKLDSRNSGQYFPRLQNEPTVSVHVSPGSVNVGELTSVMVRLNHVPAEGYTSTELTCIYDPDFVQTSNIVVGNLFGIDPVTAINGPYNGQFIVAIAGREGKKAVSSGVVLAFNVRGLRAGLASLECHARVSTGDHTLTTIGSTGTKVTILENILTPTVGPALCDKVQFVADVTIPDGTNFPPGATFTKTWRLKNVGSCTWTTSYQLVFFSGEQMGAGSSVSFSRTVAPGQVFDISVSLTAPSSPGSHRGYWMFKNANGALFGIGAQANKPWWVDIRVLAATVTPTFRPTPCDKAEFIADINVPPGTVISPGAQFIKTWRLKNVGTCTWTLSYRVAFFLGDQMGAPSSIQIPRIVAPGEMVDISLPITAPLATASYRGYWIFQNSTGLPFGVGSQGNEPWFVDLIVANGSVTPTFTPPSNVLKLNKSSSSQTYSAPDQTITYIFNITNTGTITLGPAQFTITDDKLGAPFNCGPANVTLAPGESVTCSMDYRTTSADMAMSNITNSATAAGAGQVSPPATAVVTNLVAPATPTPSITPATPTPESPTPTLTPTPIVESDWLRYINTKYWFEFYYPPQGHYAGDSMTANHARIILPFTPGTNLYEKYLDVTVVEDSTLCRSPLASSSTVDSVGMSFVNGIVFLQESGHDRTAVNINRWFAFSTSRDNVCVSLDLVLRATNPDAASTPPPFFDEVAEFAVLQQMVGTYAWLTPPTTTPDGTPIPTATHSSTPVESPTLPVTPLPGMGTVTGQVLARQPVNVDLFDAGNRLVASILADPDGTFSLTAPAGTYNIVADSHGFLSARGSVTITDGSISTKPTISLLAGDIDGDFTINHFDALTIGMNYNTSFPESADLNNDGIINVLDLELLARNYRKIGPVFW